MSQSATLTHKTLNTGTKDLGDKKSLVLGVFLGKPTYSKLLKNNFLDKRSTSLDNEGNFCLLRSRLIIVVAGNRCFASREKERGEHRNVCAF